LWHILRESEFVAPNYLPVCGVLRLKIRLHVEKFIGERTVCKGYEFGDKPKYVRNYLCIPF